MPLTPKNRKEEWLEGLVDHETTLTPKNRCEAWMKEIIDASGGGGGGTGGGVLNVGVSIVDEALVMDKTWAEINEADFAVVAANIEEGEKTWMIVVGTATHGELYTVAVACPQNGIDTITFSHFNFHTNSETGYPAMSLG